MTEQNYAGLTSIEAEKLLEQYGSNEPVPKKKENFLKKASQIICEPMFLLLIIASVIYFILGEPRDGLIMLVFVLGIISIDIIQEWKTDKTLSALRDLSAPKITVIRDGKQTVIQSTALVPGDIMLISEGIKIPADGEVIKCSDLCVDESSLTGESEGVWKVVKEEAANEGHWRKDYCYAGTLVTQGSGYILVDKTGPLTEYGKIGKNTASAKDSPSPLQKQTKSLVKFSGIAAGILFVLVCAVTFLNISDHIFKDRITESILSGITLAMAMIPEEFPVILTVFLSMGAWRLAKKNSLVRKLPSVETLGAVTVLCVDKTGTITMNKMAVQDTWATGGDLQSLCETMGLACETDTYDPMEKAMLAYCEKQGITREHLFGGKLMSEYAFTNKLKMMGHVWRHDGEIIIAAKGSPEKILNVCEISEGLRGEAEEKITEMSKKGLRVIAVGIMKVKSDEEIPSDITKCRLTLCGLIGLADPPRESVKEDIQRCREAGIRVVMITGDNGITAKSIARQIGMEDSENIITGDMLDSMDDETLRKKIREANIFSRVVPEHKMRIVKAFKENGEIVAMTGDGVNDAPALKYADIGIAMGKRGSEVSREAADIILMDDNFSTIVDTVKDGRRIFDNIQKAVGYVFSIHIPIALIALIVPLLGINPLSLLLLPLHVVILELIIDPTCSVILERQPAEANIMSRPPRDTKEKILTFKGLFKYIMQGLMIFAGSFFTYYAALAGNDANALDARSMGLMVLILSNLLLVQVNSSNSDYVFVSFKRLLKDKVMWFVNIAAVIGLIVMLYTPLNGFLKLAPLSAGQFILSAGVSAVSVLWYEGVKFVKKQKALINNK